MPFPHFFLYYPPFLSFPTPLCAFPTHAVASGPFCVGTRRKKCYNICNEWKIRRWWLVGRPISGFILQRIQEEARVRGVREWARFLYWARPSGTSDCILWKHLSCVPMTLGRVSPQPQSPKVQDRTGLPRGQEGGKLYNTGAGYQHKSGTSVLYTYKKHQSLSIWSILGGGALNRMNHSADLGVGLVGRDVPVVNHLLLGFFIDCSCIQRDVTQTDHIRSHVKHWVLMGFQCTRMSWTVLWNGKSFAINIDTICFLPLTVKEEADFPISLLLGGCGYSLLRYKHCFMYVRDQFS